MINISVATKNFLNSNWDEFVDKSNNGTIFHKQKFFNYHPKKRFKRINLIFKKNNKVVALLSGSIDRGIFISPAGASYGSFVVGDISLHTYEEVIDSFINFSNSKKFKKIIFTPPPIYYLKKQNELERYLFEYKKIKPIYQLISNALLIKNLKNSSEILNSFSDMHRRAVKKSFKNDLVIKINNDYSTFYEILIENKKKFNTVPTHTINEMMEIKKAFPKDVFLLMAYTRKKEPVAGIWAIKCNSNVVLAFYICHYYKYQNSRAVNRLFFELILWGKKNSLEWIDLGVSMDTYSRNPMEPSRSLIFFKEGIGSRGFLRSTYSYKFKK